MWHTCITAGGNGTDPPNWRLPDCTPIPPASKSTADACSCATLRPAALLLRADAVLLLLLLSLCHWMAGDVVDCILY